jgi:murein DD-endopeptidase MepM/ murein hydrolase activator NlpD
VVNRPVVSVRHAGGLVSSLEPVDASVAVGDVVGVGDALGTVSPAAGHCAPAVCVHWGLRRDGNYVNPLDYLTGFGQVRLLPLAG